MALRTNELKHILKGVQKISKEVDHYFIIYSSGEKAKINILNSHVFKYYMSQNGEFLEYPEPLDPSHEAKIIKKTLTEYDPVIFERSTLKDSEEEYIISTDKIEIRIHKCNATITVKDKRTNKLVIQETKAICYENGVATQTLLQSHDEYYFGGGMQNGRFSHKGEVIKIVNTNNWTDGGVASPCPFMWSSYGYGILRNTWQIGIYDFREKESCQLMHKEESLDAYFFVNSQPKDILNDYYELTGKPLLMPEYAFYEAHLNAFNRDYWVKVKKNEPRAILFEDGKYYKCYQPQDLGSRKGVLESLNGEKKNYQFSARAMIDRYKRHDMPLGWFVPNDGYGSGYGQTDSLQGDIDNLKSFAEYARGQGVEVGLWTESNLHPEDPDNPVKGDRDLDKEVGEAGVVALKADVAWIGSGYSFGLSAIENAAETFSKVTKHAVRPMVIMVDGWAGTQRCAGIWSGDQSGGEWEYIRFHIPTYIGTGLSGQPVVGSDMDGIYAGKCKTVNVRDYQWKTFTPLQLNMDGWGDIQKTPFSFDVEATNINRAYLKLKTMFMPYNYSVAHESIRGLPMLRAMFLEYPEENPAYTKDSQYQFMWGPSVLVAPVYNGDEDINGESIRSGIYLPGDTQIWIDFLTGEKYRGGRVLNEITVPLWKLPVFIKDGAILPMTLPHNNPYEMKRDQRIFQIYPNGETVFNVCEDDGISTEYLDGAVAVTNVSVKGPSSNRAGDLLITIDKSEGCHKKHVATKATELRIMASNIGNIKVALNGEDIKMDSANTKAEYDENVDVYYLDEAFMVNPYLTAKLTNKNLSQKFLCIKIRSVDVTKTTMQIKVNDFANIGEVFASNTVLNENIEIPKNLAVVYVTSTSIMLTWEAVENVVFYEIERDGVIFSHIKQHIGTLFDGFKGETDHCFKIRSLTDQGVSEWSSYVIGTTSEDPLSYTIQDIKVTCNLPCQSGESIEKLTDGDCKTLWHTDWGEQGKFNPNKNESIILNFDLNSVYAIEKVEYHPRDNAGNGNFEEIEYRTSENGTDWSELSGVVEWTCDASVKTIVLCGRKFRYMELRVLKSVGNFGSGKQMYFFRSK